MLAAALLTVAMATQPPEPEAPSLRLGIRGVAEQWNEPALASVYQAGAPIGAVSIGLPLAGSLWLDVEVGYRRLNSADDEELSFHLIPASVLAQWSFGHGSAQPFIAAGPTITAFQEQYAATAEGLGSIGGARLAGELRLGLRVDTGLVQPRRAPAPNPVKDVGIELYVARRQAGPIGGRTGFDLGAWRAALGLSLAL